MPSSQTFHWVEVVSERGPLNIVVLYSQIHCSKGMSVSVRTGQRNKDLQDVNTECKFTKC